MGIADQIVQVESGGNPNAQNPNSSAGGLGQFIDSTWLNTLKRHRPDLVDKYSTSDLLAMKRGDPDLARSMTDAYASDNAAFLRDRGHEPTPANVYLAHFAGPEGAASLLGAQPTAKVSSILSPAAVKANPFLQNMTVADLQNWAGGKMGGSATPAATGFSQFSSAAGAAGAPTGGAAPAAPTADATAQPAAADPLAAIPAMIAQNQQPAPFLPSMHIPTQMPPGIARAQALARAMALRPLTGVVAK